MKIIRTEADIERIMLDDGDNDVGKKVLHTYIVSTEYNGITRKIQTAVEIVDKNIENKIWIDLENALIGRIEERNV
jgi:hypothetical protein